MEHMSLNNETGLDPDGIRVRPVSGLVAADYFAPGYFVWAVLIQNLAQIGYEEKNMHMAAYDWRLTFQNTEVRFHGLLCFPLKDLHLLPILDFGFTSV
jgi:phospholipid:diacylglycerol acyltransferase